VTTAKSATLALIDDANITQGVFNFGGGIDTVLCGAANYLKFKAEAQARMQITMVNDMPEYAKIGFQFEAFKYQNVIIASDPFIQDYSTGTWPSGVAATDISAYVFCMTLKDVYMDIHPAHNFRASPLVDQGEAAPAATTPRPASSA